MAAKLQNRRLESASSFHKCALAGCRPRRSLLAHPRNAGYNAAKTNRSERETGYRCNKSADCGLYNRRRLHGANSAAEATAQRGATDFSAGFIRAAGEYPDALVGAEIRAINLFGRLHF